MNFPHIDHIDDLRPHVKDLPHIKEYVRPGFTVFNYTFADYSLFPSPHSLECRGIKFDNRGHIIARPFHKFFNLLEGGVTHDPSQPHHVYHKLDGSMIHYARTSDGEFLPMTKMGHTDVAKQVSAWADPDLVSAISDWDSAEYTLLFEWTSPQNRIVLPYIVPQLTLIAARHLHSGKYVSHDALCEIAHGLQCPLVDFFHEPLEVVKTLQGKEGVVIVYDTGHRLKVKADEYVAIHRVKDSLIFEKNVLMAVLTNSIDDWLSILPPEDKAAAEAYSAQILSWIISAEIFADEFYDQYGRLSRKEYALEAQKLPDFGRGLAFARLDAKDDDYVITALRKIAISGTKIEALAADYPSFPRWNKEIPVD